jgi:hypothetical protein
MALTGMIGVAEVKIKGYPINDKTDPHNRPPREAGVRTVRFTVKSELTDLDDWQDRMFLMEIYTNLIMNTPI